jgi:hypothetical protein
MLPTSFLTELKMLSRSMVFFNPFSHFCSNLASAKETVAIDMFAPI